MTDLPVFIPALFILTTFITFIFFVAAVKKNNTVRTTVIVSVIILFWLLLHGLLASRNFYAVTDGLPPRFTLAVAPAFIFILLLFISKAGRKFIDSLSPYILTQLHVVRVFVEVILYWLSLHLLIPTLMTFEGRNFDIIAGITAPLVAYFGFVKRRLSKKIMLLWNIVCLLLLLNIVTNAVLSAPFTFQQYAFDQPNVAVLYFPFVWLPCFIVPVVLLSHLVLIRWLLKYKS